MSNFIDWSKLKSLMGTWRYEETDSFYNVFRVDGSIVYRTNLLKSEYQLTGSDTKDFYDNYKTDIDNKKLPCCVVPRDEDGLPLNHLQNIRRTNYFAGVDDDTGVSDGSNRLEFNMTTNDTSKSVSMVFSEDVWVMDAIIITKDAPLGSRFDIEILHPTGPTKVSGFGKGCPMLGTNNFHLTPSKKGLLPAGMILRITIHNASIAANFQVVAIAKMDRETTA